MRRLEPFPQEIRRNEVLDGQAGPPPTGALELTQGMITKGVRQLHEGDAFKQQLLQGQIRGIIGQVIGQIRDHGLQGTQQLRRQCLQKLRAFCISLVIPDQALPGAGGAIDGGFQRLRCGFFDPQ